MAVLYTRKQIQDALAELRILPIDGKVNGQEAARILTWRAKAEQGIEHVYTDVSIRRHVEQGNLKIAEKVNSRFNRYRVEDVFLLPISPHRGLKQQQTNKKAKTVENAA